MTEYLTLDDLIRAAREAIGREPEVRDWGLLESALARPQTSVFAADAYPTLEDKAAALLHSLLRNYALVDGNKRLGWVAMRLFLILNQRDLHAPDVHVAEAFVHQIVRGELEVPAVAAVLTSWSQPLPP